MARKIPLRQLEIEIMKELGDYKAEVTERLKSEVIEVAKKTDATLKATSPKRSGKYARGWTHKVLFESQEDIRVCIYNRTKPQITHVLENGHAKQNGGRVEGIPHIGPAEQQAEKELEGKVKVIVRP